MIVRFDDVCGNTNMTSLVNHSLRYRDEFKAEIWWAVSPCYVPSANQRVYPESWNPLSDFRVHYNLTKVDFPIIPDWVRVVSHGICHVDHRLLEKSAQEMSIVLSCSLLGATAFCPPFNHYNTDTENVCDEHGIKLIRYEDGWKSIEHNPFDPEWSLWYAHHRNLPGFWG